MGYGGNLIDLCTLCTQAHGQRKVSSVRITPSPSLIMPSVRSICFRRFLRPLFSLGVLGRVIESRVSKSLFASGGLVRQGSLIALVKC